jgi:hypothetical protein
MTSAGPGSSPGPDTAASPAVERTGTSVMQGAAGNDGPSFPPVVSTRRRSPSPRSWRDRRRRPVPSRVAGASRFGEVSPERARSALARGIEPPIDTEEVGLIASEGFPFWESVEVMRERNQRITLGYADLSDRLAAAIASGDPGRDANWCTFATWSSFTIGRAIERLTHRSGYAVAEAAPDRTRGAVTAILDRLRLDRTFRRAVARSEAASLRALAAGNRSVFLEVGLAVATFLDHFPDRTFIAPGADADQQWEECWREIQVRLQVFTRLDPTWVLTANPPQDKLELGLRQYLEAMLVDDPALRSQHVLAGNLLVTHYEQERVDGYIWAALALFTDAAMLRLLRDRTGDVGGVRKLPSSLFARYMTRRIILLLCGEPIAVSRPIAEPPAPPREVTSPVSPMSASSNGGASRGGLTSIADVTLPLLQALITRYQLSPGRWPDAGARNWTSFDDRMRTIGNLFQLRQRQPGLLDPPFDPATTEAILRGTAPPARSEQGAD